MQKNYSTAVRSRTRDDLSDPAMPVISPDDQATLRNAVRRVADPQFIILFGSQARGSAHVHSDVDLLIVEDKSRWQASSRRKEIARVRRALPPVGAPIDLLLFTPAEVAKWRHARNHVISEAMERGVILYERPRARSDDA